MSKAQEKTERVLKALRHEEPDRVPIHEWFSTEFVERWTQWRKEQGDEEVPNINDYYDLDMLLIEPNIDPKVESCQILERTDDYVIFKSGFGCTIKKIFSRLDEDYLAPMPQFLDYDLKSPDDYAQFEFDDPADERRFYGIRQDIISGDGFTPYPSFVETVESVKDNFCLCGGVTEAWETLWRMRGIANAMIDLVRAPEKTKAFCQRIVDFSIESAKEQVRLGGFKVMYLWGDVAFKQGIMFPPQTWREILFPPLKRICDALHKLDTVIIYHGCGNNPDFLIDWFLEAGIDALNPLEIKAGMDVLHLKRKYGRRLALNGGIDNAGVLSNGDKALIRQHVLTTMNAAKGGGYVLQSDHSIPGNVAPESYDYMFQVYREHANYPLDLGEFEVAV